MKQNNQKLSLYRETLRRLLLAGLIVFTVPFVISLLIVALAIFPSGRGYLSWDDTTLLLAGYMFVAPLVLTSTAFSFLFRRNASDFYHALPVTRTTLFGSSFAAILTYLFGSMLLITLPNVLGHLWIGQPVASSEFLRSLFGYFSGAALIAACAAIGVSLTGTRLSAFVVTGLTLFMPRFLVACAVLILSGTAPMLDINQMWVWKNMNLHIPVFLFLSPFFEGFSSITVWSILYTLLLAVVHTALAGVAFHRRASEVAGRPAPGPVLQHVFRSLLAMPLFLAMFVIFVSSQSDVTGSFYTDFDIILTLGVMGALVYFLYELFTTKKLKSLLPAVCTFPIVIVVSAVVSLGIVSYGNAQMKIFPAASEIKSVQLSNVGSSTPTYTELLESEVELNDAALMEMIANTFPSTYAYYQSPSTSMGMASRKNLSVHLKNGRTLHRTLQLNSAEAEYFDSVVSANEALLEAKHKLPADNEISEITFSGGFDVPVQETQALWALYKSEYDADYIDTADAFSPTYYNPTFMPAATEEVDATKTDETYAVTPEDAWVESDVISLHAYVNVRGARKGRPFRDSYRLNSAMRETTAAFVRLNNQSKETALREIADLSTPHTFIGLSVELQLYNIDVNGKKYSSSALSFQQASPHEHAYDYLPKDNPALYKRLGELVPLLVNLDTTNIDTEKPFLAFSLNLGLSENSNGSFNSYYLGDVYANVDDAMLTKIMHLLELEKPDFSEQ
ncbi:hypothetical protein LJC07_07975 [Christensenellaceae bacterium OttesenSCG-928-L17]|nr:hypothetical protein [Christensenellaceae bacterium OttesenSCG-928-L17]